MRSSQEMSPRYGREDRAVFWNHSANKISCFWLNGSHNIHTMLRTHLRGTSRAGLKPCPWYPSFNEDKIAVQGSALSRQQVFPFHGSFNQNPKKETQMLVREAPSKKASSEEFLDPKKSPSTAKLFSLCASNPRGWNALYIVSQDVGTAIVSRVAFTIQQAALKDGRHHPKGWCLIV